MKQHNVILAHEEKKIMPTTIVVLGDGAWGTAIAQTVASAGNAVTLWCYDAHVAHDIGTFRENKKYLPGFLLHPNITTSTDLACINTADIIFEAIPVSFLRSVLQKIPQNTGIWIALSKGIEQKTLAVSSDIIQETIKPHEWAVLSGPSYARDLAHQQPTGFTYAALSEKLLPTLKQIFPPFCTFDYSSDTHGVQLYGALKNILALGVGIIEGAGYTDNTQALFFTRLFTEITLLAHACGAEEQTQMSLAGIGDAILTGYGKESKNKKLGLLLGSGTPLAHALQQFPTAPESVNTLVSAQQLAQQKKVTLPLFSALAAYIHGSITVQEIIKKL